MEPIEENRNRLATLTVSGRESLAACRALQNGLRKLKRDVLAQILTLRTRTRKEAREAMATEPTLRNLWKRRKEIVDDAVDNVREKLTGEESEDEDAEALEAWSEINREVDRRLERLDELEAELARAAGEDVAKRPSVRGRPRSSSDSADDDLYAAVGAESQEQRRSRRSCPECGTAIAAGDRFCGRCGQRVG
jgi:ribosomal protein S27AE